MKLTSPQQREAAGVVYMLDGHAWQPGEPTVCAIRFCRGAAVQRDLLRDGDGLCLSHADEVAFARLTQESEPSRGL